jgi:hypothetical protein
VRVADTVEEQTTVIKAVAEFSCKRNTKSVSTVVAISDMTHIREVLLKMYLPFIDFAQASQAWVGHLPPALTPVPVLMGSVAGWPLNAK